MRVLALTKYGPLAASTRQRFLQYLPYLAERGSSVDVVPLIGPDIAVRSGIRSVGAAGIARGYAARLGLLLRARRYDLIWVQYEVFPYFPGWADRLALPANVPVVVDLDDAIFHVYDQHPNRLFRQLVGRKFEPLLKRASACVCGNAYLSEYAARFCAASIIVPTVLDTDVYSPGVRSSPGPPVIGWLGSRTTWANVEPLLPVIVAKVESGAARFLAIGAGAAAEGRSGIDAVEWTERGEIDELRRMDIGIMPLFDQPFERGKCGYKLIQYMACGVATVASPVGVNAQIVRDGQSGFLATSGGEWSQALDRLLADAALRAKMGAVGRKLAVELYSLAAHKQRMHRILTAAATGDRAILDAMARGEA